jgi:histidinol-phosphate/aromatic aminotransferase/cobyric acid decarboxylase-like protein
MRRELIAAHRRRIAQALADAGLDAPPSQANVLWVGGDGGLGGRLERAGIVALAGGTLGDPSRLRITVPHLPHDVDRLLRALDC